jgi:putative flippase GtrA
MNKLITSAMKARFIRFVFTGGVNTAVTYFIYLLLLQVLNYQVSYTIAFVSGIAIAFLLNKLFVFKTHRGWKTVMLYPFVYFAQYIFGMLLLWFVVGQLDLSVELGPLVVVILTIPLTYWLSRLAFVGLESRTNRDIRKK